jgi:hypothetical protein
MPNFRVVVAILALAIFGATNMFAQGAKALIEERETNGGEHGYKTVDEIHDSETNYHLLDCYDPGFSSCCWEIVPGGRLLGYAHHQIDIGIYSGNYSMVDANVKYSVVWSAQDAYNVHIQETQESVSSVE